MMISVPGLASGRIVWACSSLDCGGPWYDECFLEMGSINLSNACLSFGRGACSPSLAEYPLGLLSVGQDVVGCILIAKNLWQDNLAVRVGNIVPLQATIGFGPIGGGS